MVQSQLAKARPQLEHLTGVLGFVVPRDALDRMVAIGYGTLAVQQLDAGTSGVMMALRDGRYTTVPADTCITGEKRVDVAELYDADAYRPRIRHMLGKPMYLY